MTDLVVINNSLMQQDLFAAFKNQLKKDFETSGLETDFIDDLPQLFLDLRTVLENQIKLISKNSSTFLYSLLYRIDISETQIKKYLNKNQNLSFELAVAELMIKRILQKVVFKKHYSS